MEIRIRTYRQADEQDVIGLWARTGLTVPWNDPARDIARKVAQQPELFFVAEVDGAVIGSAMAGYDGHRGWIFYMGVEPALQGRGVARALLAHAEAVLKARGCPKVELMVRETNATVMDFYRHLGYGDEPVKVLSKRLIADD